MRQPQRKLDNHAIAAEYHAGMSTIALGKKYNLPANAILYRLRRVNARIRRSGAPEGNQNWKGGQG